MALNVTARRIGTIIATVALLHIRYLGSSNLSACGFQQVQSIARKAASSDSSRCAVSPSNLPNINDAETSGDVAHQCRFCSESFPSRNALFRHLCSDPLCSRHGGKDKNDPKTSSMTRQTMAFLFAYCSVSDNMPLQEEGEVIPEAELAGSQLRDAVSDAWNSLVRDQLHVDVEVRLVSSTQATVAKLRHRSLSQERGSAAAEDVMVISFMAPTAVNTTLNGQKWATEEEPQRLFSGSVCELTKQNLSKNKKHNVEVRLISCEWIPTNTNFHAERSCTQRIYHYMLPLSWLPDGKLLEKWWLDQCRKHCDEGDAVGKHRNKAWYPPPTDGLRELKMVLRSAESAVLQSGVRGDKSRKDKHIKEAVGRFGLLAAKARRPWHNFADPSLCGDASPNHEPVWRVLDSIKIHLITQEEEAMALLEFRGDDFLKQQIRRIVGTVVAVTHGWLPPNVFDVATRSDVLIKDMPVAPSGRLYLAGTRFHFDELQRNGRGIFQDSTEGGESSSQSSWVKEQLLHRKSLQSSLLEEKRWHENLRDVVSPRIRSLLAGFDPARNSNPEELASSRKLKHMPDDFDQTLSLLRDIVASGAWPKTSAARSSIIRNVQKLPKKGDIAKSNKKAAGSFTVVNPSLSHTMDKDFSLPMGNALFPEVVGAVFQLELAVAGRPPSTHCAINCNAEFTPHVDSGSGAGQSLSMIVGLGDYVGGELMLEGVSHDVRYEPLEFDGWKMRHWTNRFVGERFSLVWFTPEKKGQ